jgi:hypothetical protein
VVDVRGRISEEQDIVLFDRQYTPFLFNQDGTTYIPAEGVYAVFEAKQEINAGLLRYAGKKAESVRRLYRTNAVIHHIGGKQPGKKLPRILAGFLALDSGWAKGHWATHAKKTLAGFSAVQRLDVLSVLTEGSAAVRYGRSGPAITVSDEGLSFLFLELLRRLQCMGTVPAIEYPAYGRSIPTRHI